jgi:hypothetical protein
MQSKKSLIIKAFSEMNISLLEVLLDDNNTYQNATKETFLEKLNVVFEQFKQSGDTTLLLFAGKCNGKSCDSYKHKGYSFVGNHSHSFIDFIFDETEIDFKDIYHCCDMKAKEVDIKKKSKFYIEVRLDEKAKYSPSPSKAKVFQKCKDAYNEIVKSKHQIITNEILISWLERNRSLYNHIEDNSNGFLILVYRSVDNFRNLYISIESRIKYIESQLPAYKALEEYKNLDVSLEPIILKWLVVHEELYNNASDLLYSIDNDGKLKINHPQLLVEQKYMEGNYKIMTEFVKQYKEHYWEMLYKYQVHDDETSKMMYADSEEYKKHYSIKHNLEKRGIKI